MVIIGAGVAGLAAAQRLIARGKSVVVLEARDRIGGRIWTRHVPGLVAPVELGAEFLHAEARESRALLRRARVPVVDVSGQRWFSTRGRLEKTRAFEKRLDKVLGRFRDDLSEDRSVADALAAMRSLHSDDRRLGTRFVEGFHAADAEQISEQSLAGSGGPAALRIARAEGGYDRLVNALGAPNRESVRLDHVVKRLTWSPGRVVVEATSAGGQARREVEADRAIITLPLGVLQSTSGRGHVEFSPAIPRLDAAARQLVMGCVTRVTLRFDEAFWTSATFAKRHGTAGDPTEFKDMSFVQSLADVPFPVWWTMYPLETPALVGWTGGPSAKRLAGLSPDDITDVAVQSLTKVFGVARSTISRRLRDAFMHDWMTDPYSRGAYSYVAVGGSRAPAVLARPVERTLYFAGEHASAGRNGTVDGAMASGFRAAGQILRGRSG